MKNSILYLIIALSFFSCRRSPAPQPILDKYRLTKISHSNGSETNYTYNAQNKIVKEDWANPLLGDDYTSEYTYNSAGQLITIFYLSHFSGNGSTSITERTYNAQGFLIKELITGIFDGKSYEKEITYTLNSKGEMIESQMIEKDSNGNWLPALPINKAIYTRNSQGDIIKSENGAGNVYVEYTYDANKNNLTTKQIIKNGTSFFLEREWILTYDAKINPKNMSFGVESPNNLLSSFYQIYNANGVITYSIMTTNTILYNDQNLPIKVNNDIYSYEKY